MWEFSKSQKPIHEWKRSNAAPHYYRQKSKTSRQPYVALVKEISAVLIKSYSLLTTNYVICLFISAELMR
ncbi:unnamed protein product [Gongylonema pulchrum]|uniref:Ovule protein n=1 Tax=Gongylonema pulchrum TaxID=637853 RepID=A0A183ES30_9BILA|nr:unnamed protein product [Gongylonema pulchrum]